MVYLIMILHFTTLVRKDMNDKGQYLFAGLESTKHFPYFNYSSRPNLHHISVTIESYALNFDNQELIKDLKNNHKFIKVEIHIND